jgi:signal transduction histidine kinase
MAETDTRALVEAVVESLPRPAAFDVTIAGDWPVVATVPQALDLVLRNLVDNAIKHHDRTAGRVTVAAAPGGPRTLLITVSDDGPGIPVAFHGAAFQPFRRLAAEAEAGDGHAIAEAQQTRSIEPASTASWLDPSEGSGIGLALVRKTAETTGATITLVSDPSRQRGTTFTLHWPIAAAATQAGR